jgi:hypothetical protein
MNQNVLIQQKDGKKICNIEEHYGLPTIEFNPMPIKEMVAKQEDDGPIKQEDDDPIQKEDDPATTSHTDQIVASGSEDDVPVQANFEKNDSVQANFEAVDFEDKNPSYASVDSVNSNSD